MPDFTSASIERKIKENVEQYVHRKGFGESRTPMPNIIEYIYKGRYSIYSSGNIKVWSHFDRGTFRRKDFFVTDANNEIINVPVPKLEKY